jgi:hypothetical protein
MGFPSEIQLKPVFAVGVAKHGSTSSKSDAASHLSGGSPLVASVTGRMCAMSCVRVLSYLYLAVTVFLLFGKTLIS